MFLYTFLARSGLTDYVLASPSPTPTQVLLQLHLALEKQEQCCTIHYIRTGPCILEDMPWVTIQEHKPASLKYDWKQICAMCKPVLNPNQATYSAFELVYGKAGV